MTAHLFRWPVAAQFGRRVPKEKFYEHAKISAAVRERFVTEVQRISWEFKLADITVNLAGSAEVPEIQVFMIEVKGADVSESVLRAIDSAIPFPIIFEIVRDAAQGREIRMVAAHKQLGAGKPKVSSYFSTAWVAADVTRQALPTAITLPGLYAAMLQTLMPLKVLPGEDMSEVTARMSLVYKLEREIMSLQRKLGTELQLNRRVEIRRSLRAKEQELQELVRNERTR